MALRLMRHGLTPRRLVVIALVFAFSSVPLLLPASMEAPAERPAIISTPAPTNAVAMTTDSGSPVPESLPATLPPETPMPSFGPKVFLSYQYMAEHRASRAAKKNLFKVVHHANRAYLARRPNDPPQDLPLAELQRRFSEGIRSRRRDQFSAEGTVLWNVTVERPPLKDTRWRFTQFESLKEKRRLPVMRKAVYGVWIPPYFLDHWDASDVDLSALERRILRQNPGIASSLLAEYNLALARRGHARLTRNANPLTIISREQLIVDWRTAYPSELSDLVVLAAEPKYARLAEEQPSKKTPERQFFPHAVYFPQRTCFTNYWHAVAEVVIPLLAAYCRNHWIECSSPEDLVAEAFNASGNTLKPIKWNIPHKPALFLELPHKYWNFWGPMNEGCSSMWHEFTAFRPSTFQSENRAAQPNTPFSPFVAPSNNKRVVASAPSLFDTVEQQNHSKGEVEGASSTHPLDDRDPELYDFDLLPDKTFSWHLSPSSSRQFRLRFQSLSSLRYSQREIAAKWRKLDSSMKKHLEFISPAYWMLKQLVDVEHIYMVGVDQDYAQVRFPFSFIPPTRIGMLIYGSDYLCSPDTAVDVFPFSAAESSIPFCGKVFATFRRLVHLQQMGSTLRERFNITSPEGNGTIFERFSRCLLTGQPYRPVSQKATLGSHPLPALHEPCANDTTASPFDLCRMRAPENHSFSRCETGSLRLSVLVVTRKVEINGRRFLNWDSEVAPLLENGARQIERRWAERNSTKPLCILFYHTSFHDIPPALQRRLIGEADILIAARGASTAYVEMLQPGAAVITLFPSRPSVAISKKNDNFPWWPFSVYREDILIRSIPCHGSVPREVSKKQRSTGSKLSNSQVPFEGPNCLSRSVNFCDLQCDPLRVLAVFEEITWYLILGWQPAAGMRNATLAKAVKAEVQQYKSPEVEFRSRGQGGMALYYEDETVLCTPSVVMHLELIRNGSKTTIHG